MFALPGLLLLVFVDFVRPQEYFLFLAAVPLLYVATGMAILGFLVDLRVGISRLEFSPQVVLTLLLLAWCIFTVAVKAPGELQARVQPLIIPFAIYLIVSNVLQTFRRMQVLAGVLLAIALGLAAIAVHQAFAPFGCHREVLVRGLPGLRYDGRPCVLEERFACENDAAEPGADYRCERVGLLGTSSIRGRVRYRGTLEDPNELAVVLGTALPFAFAFYDRRRTFWRLLLVVLSVGLIGAATYFTKSRGGQLVFLTVLATYFMRRVGVARGLVAGMVMALPILLFGGREGGESSTEERTECWWIGMHLFTASPVLGVGAGRFTEYHFLTAHNSVVLAAAELGMIGLVLWTSVLYVSMKIPYQALHEPVAPVARTWAVAMVASLAGLMVGIFFLSFVYKNALWIYVGLSGVLYHAIKRHLPSFRIRFGLRDLGYVALIAAALVVLLIGYTGMKLGW